MQQVAPPTERPVRGDIGPDMTRERLAFGQDRHGRVVAMQPLGPAAWRSIIACSRCSTAVPLPDQVRQVRHAKDINAFPSIRSLLPGSAADVVQTIRIMASRFGPAKARDMTWNGAGCSVTVSQHRQKYLSAHLPHSQRVGDILAQLRQLRRYRPAGSFPGAA